MTSKIYMIFEDLIKITIKEQRFMYWKIRGQIIEVETSNEVSYCNWTLDFSDNQSKKGDTMVSLYFFH